MQAVAILIGQASLLFFQILISQGACFVFAGFSIHRGQRLVRPGFLSHHSLNLAVLDLLFNVLLFVEMDNFICTILVAIHSVQ